MQSNAQINLVQLIEDSDIGLINVGFTGKVVTKEDGTRVAEIWATFALGQSNGMGGVNVAEIQFRKVGEADAKELVQAFINAREASKQKSNLIVPIA